MNAKMFWMMQIARRPLCGVGNAISGAISPKNSFQSSKKEVNQSINSVMHLHSLTVKKNKKARQGKARQGKARQGKARQGKARQGKGRQGKVRYKEGIGRRGVLIVHLFNMVCHFWSKLDLWIFCQLTLAKILNQGFLEI